MSTVILLNEESTVCQAYSVDNETLDRVRDLLSNKHNMEPESEKPKSRGKLITLRFRGKCSRCGHPIVAGEQAWHVKKGWVEHDTCPTPEVKAEPIPAAMFQK